MKECKEQTKMQGTGYKKCYMMAKKINTEYLPMVTEAYNSYIKDAKSLIQENESLNRTRSITEGAVKCLSDGYGSHPADVSLIKSHLGDLRNNNAEIKNASRKVNLLLENNQSWFKKEYAQLMRTNNDVLTYFKDTKKTAPELEADLKSIAKTIMSLINTELPAKISEIKGFITKLDNKVTSSTDTVYKKIQDTGDDVLYNYKKNIIWSDVDSEFLATKAAFFDNEYGL